MSKVNMVSLTWHRFGGKQLRPGDPFVSSRSNAKILKALKKARYETDSDEFTMPPATDTIATSVGAEGGSQPTSESLVSNSDWATANEARPTAALQPVVDNVATAAPEQSAQIDNLDSDQKAMESEPAERQQKDPAEEASQPEVSPTAAKPRRQYRRRDITSKNTETK